VKGKCIVREKEFEKLTQALMADGRDFVERMIPYQGGAVRIYFIAQLTDRDFLTQNVIKPLVLHCSSVHEPVSARRTADRLIYAENISVETNFDLVEKHILSGMTVLLFSTDKEYLVINSKAVEHRAVPTPELSFTLRGSLDCFTENMNTNLSLLRYRMQDKNLRINYFMVGRRTRTSVAVVYVEDIADPTLVNQIQNKILAIDVDGIGASGELQALLLNRPYQLFPQMGVIERSDMAYNTLLDGKTVILVDGSKDAIYAPKTFTEFFYSSDDRYDNKVFGFFARMLRYLSLVVALTTTSLYVAVTSFHTDVLPSDYAILLSTLRSNTPFNAMIGSLLLETIMELLREALLRVPKQIGPAIGIVGAIVIGQAAIAAGIFSSLLLILSAVSLLASFAIPDYTLIAPFRILKFFVIFATGFFGFFGFTVALITILTLLVSNTSFGIPFMTPFAPYSGRDFSKALVDKSHISKWRPGYLRNKDQKRM
jgi:spore germination protein KA